MNEILKNWVYLFSNVPNFLDAEMKTICLSSLFSTIIFFYLMGMRYAKCCIQNVIENNGVILQINFQYSL